MEWKRARVTPIFKGGEREEMSNYRPISIIPIIMKMLEKAVNVQLLEYLTENDILAKEQSGFRKAHSTYSVLCYVSDVLYKEMDKGRLTGVVFLDLKKAFD